jgi:hypothetical protein
MKKVGLLSESFYDALVARHRVLIHSVYEALTKTTTRVVVSEEIMGDGYRCACGSKSASENGCSKCDDDTTVEKPPFRKTANLVLHKVVVYQSQNKSKCVLISPEMELILYNQQSSSIVIDDPDCQTSGDGNRYFRVTVEEVPFESLP